MRSNLNLGYFFNVLLCDFSYCEIVLCAVHGNCQLLIDAVLLHDFIHLDYLRQSPIRLVGFFVVQRCSSDADHGRKFFGR